MSKTTITALKVAIAAIAAIESDADESFDLVTLIRMRLQLRIALAA